MAIKDNNSRQYFRIRYPSLGNPLFEFGKHKFPVIDVSEGGFRFIPKKGLPFFEGDFIEGKLVFGKRGIVDIKGTVLRITISDVAIKLDEASHIPLTRIMEEQRLLIQKGKL